jgi:hypothetical protein
MVRLISAGLAAAGILAAGALAAPPVADALLPAGGQAGTEIALLTVVGKVEPWPCQVWCSNLGVTFTPGAKAGEYKVAIAKNAAPGPCLVRFHNAEGVSEPKLFLVGKVRELIEDEKVDNNGAAKTIPVGVLPVTINARLDKSGDFDAWKVTLKKGHTLHGRLDGYGLRSAIDPYLHVYDLASGARVLLASDGPRNLDPWLTFTAPRDGDYAVAVTSAGFPASTTVEFFGAAKAVYRLSLATNAADLGPVPGADSLPTAPAKAPLKGFGTLAKPGETDRIVFSATKGQSLRIKADAVGQGFPTDPVLVVEKGDGTLIREIDDDRTTRDAVFPLKVAADGEYAVKIGDRFHRGGPEFRYWLQIDETVPDFSVTADAVSYAGKTGETISVKLKVTRLDGHTGALVATVTGLPAGVTAAPAKIAEKGVDGTLELKVDAAAAPFSGPIRVEVAEESGEKKLTRPAVFSFQGADARGPYLIDEVSDLWLTVLPKEKPKEEKKDEKAK